MTTPARKQYLRIKADHSEEILLFRMGDFYETFDDDAKLISKELEIALTSREMGKGQRIPLAGIPYHSLEPYLSKLIKRGHRVAICEQTSDPKQSKGIVDRDVVRVVTAGTITEESILQQNSNNYLAAILVDGDSVGISHVDITTSEFFTTQTSLQQLPMLLDSLSPSEILIGESDKFLPEMQTVMITRLKDTCFNLDVTKDILLKHFKVSTLEPYGCDGLDLACRTAGAIIDYLIQNQKIALSQISTLSTYSTENYMVLDRQTRRNLELFEGGRWGGTENSLLEVLDHTHTPMGARLLKRWLSQPLLSVDLIKERQKGVTWFKNNGFKRNLLIQNFTDVSDIERLINRIRGGSANPRDLVGLAISLSIAPDIRTTIENSDESTQLYSITSKIKDNHDPIGLIRSSIVDNPPVSIGNDQVIKTGFSTELDQLRNSEKTAQNYIAELERSERERTGIKTLKIGYNRVFGYYIEITRPHLTEVPEEYIRRQSLVSAERFITPEMKEHESLILNAQERIGEIESSMFRQICQQLATFSTEIMDTAKALAQLDVLCSFGEIATINRYERPDVNDGDLIEISEGRHPIVENNIPSGEFVPNETNLNQSTNQLIILTGPNMSGKSTYIRQVALMVLMAQIGSFIPAKTANIGIVDRIYTRIGLQDDLSVGQSTFMVEMVETASIINQASSKSLIILDEIGRGTSTYDGLAIARATAEYLHNNPNLGCKTLFATHYHELTELADNLPKAKNFNVLVSENKGDVIFLRKIVEGGADKSYGIHVARMAGIPNTVVNRAWDILLELENKASTDQSNSLNFQYPATPAHKQLAMFDQTSTIVQELLDLDISSLTPMESINILYSLQKKISET
ncbi:MAG: DNA mismatch repair protein MutS [Chloroflexota bacterium]|nr:DNA mismatch repair protein MutS [Chloroflexota bacterium]